MQRLLALALCLAPLPAAAHVGHLAEVGGHNHWIGAAAIGAAVVIGLYGALKGRKPREEQPEAEAEPTDGTDDKETA
jgi:hypothetical protein